MSDCFYISLKCKTRPIDRMWGEGWGFEQRETAVSEWEREHGRRCQGIARHCLAYLRSAVMSSERPVSGLVCFCSSAQSC